MAQITPMKLVPVTSECVETERPRIIVDEANASTLTNDNSGVQQTSLNATQQTTDAEIGQFYADLEKDMMEIIRNDSLTEDVKVKLFLIALQRYQTVKRSNL